MIKIFATEKIKEIDRYTIQRKSISSIDLVEEAVTVFTNEFRNNYPKTRRVIVFAGQGNNGADALGIARQLLDESYRVVVYLFNTTGYLSPECAENKRRLLNIEQVEFVEVRDDFTPPVLTPNDVIVDGLFGSGLNRPLEGGYSGLVKYLNESPSEIVSIDIPSGLFGEDNRDNDKNSIIKANKTYTFNFPKLSFLFPENEQFVGEWKVLPLDMDARTIEETPSNYYIVREEDIANAIPPRSRFSHKGTYGHALLIAGSRGKMGAALLSAKGCLRSGAGMLTVHLPRCGEPIMQTAFPEAMVSIDAHNDFFTTMPALQRYSVVGIGPGLGQQLESAVAMDELLSSVMKKPMVIDADAINIIANNPDLLPKIPSRSILTPHPVEFDRIAGKSSSAYERLQKAREFAKEHELCIVLKGAYTAVCTSEGNVYFTESGNPGMATAGSGDVLTGIILGLLAQSFEPETAAVAGVYLHATAGDFAANQWSEQAMIAGDIVNALGKAFKTII